MRTKGYGVNFLHGAERHCAHHPLDRTIRSILSGVIAEIVPPFYDVEGKRIFRPSKKRHGGCWAIPIGSYFSQPLKLVCRDIDEVRAFLSTCRYVSDREQFGVADYWAAPEQFEQTRKSDCDDFALWTWRQLVALGYDARFVTGAAGRYGGGHAWVTFRVLEKTFVVEPQLARAGRKFPRLDALRYKPLVSVQVAGSHVKYFKHLTPENQLGFRDVAPLIPEWLLFRLRIVPRVFFKRFLAFCVADSTKYALRSDEIPRMPWTSRIRRSATAIKRKP